VGKVVVSSFGWCLGGLDSGGCSEKARRSKGHGEREPLTEEDRA